MSGFNWGRFTISGLGNQGGTQNSPTAWDTIDVNGSSYFNGAMSNAAAVILRVENTGADLAFGVRHGNSTDTFYQDVRTLSMFDVVVGVEDAGAGVYNIDIATETAASFNIYLVAWIGDDICFMNTNAQNMGQVGTAGTYETETVTSQGGDTAKIAFYHFNAGAASNYTAAARHPSASTYDPYEAILKGGWGSCSLNGSEQFEWKCSSTTPTMYVMGYLKGSDVTSVTEPADRNSGLSDGAYATITASTADYLAYVAHNNATGGTAPHAYAVRNTQDANDDYGDQNREIGWRYVEFDTAIEAKLEDVSDQELFEVWYGSNPAAPAGDITIPVDPGGTPY